MIENNYPNSKLVMGMIYSQDLNQCIEEIKLMITQNKKIGGVFIWEYCFADNNNPLNWAIKINQILNNKIIVFYNKFDFKNYFITILTIIWILGISFHVVNNNKTCNFFKIDKDGNINRTKKK